MNCSLLGEMEDVMLSQWTVQKLSAEDLTKLSPRTFDLADIFTDRQAWAPPKGCLLVIKEDSDYVACAGFKPIAPRACEISPFVISYEYRGKGLGSKLMQTLLQEARAAGYVRIVSHIEPWCPEWRAFYQAHGFEFVEDDNAAHPSGATAVELMLK